MRVFTENEIEKYLEYMDKNVLPLSELEGRCHMCGRFLKDVKLPEGPERKVTCLECRDFFQESFEELIEMGELRI